MKTNCWDFRATNDGSLAKTCKNGCVYFSKRESKKIPDDITCWEYIGCQEKCEIRVQIGKERPKADTQSAGLLGRGKRVLVLDDSKTLRNLIKMILEEYEYDVETSASARDALEKVNKWHPHVMTCDINLSGSSRSGLDVLAQMTKFKRDTKILMVSSKGDRDTVEFCLKEGAAAFIHKPFKNDDLVKKISQALRSE